MRVNARARPAKSGRTLHTEEEIAVALENVERYEWAKDILDAALSFSSRWISMSDEDILRLVPPPSVPRAFRVHDKGCPIHGETIHKGRNFYNPWIVNPERPWKVKCPIGGEEYPSNDFEAYLQTGMKDRSLLTGDYVDDGWGWLKPDGDGLKYWFVAYYNRVQRWGREILPACRSLSLAYLLTGEDVYAHKAAVLLWKIASYYPNYRYEVQSRYGTEINPDYRGKILDHISECRVALELAEAYDNIFPALREDKALQKLVGQSADEVQEFIETRLLREMATGIMEHPYTIRGNYGMHQNALITIAITLDDDSREPTKSRMINWALNNRAVHILTDVGINYAIHNLIHRDGVPHESPGYNTIWLRNLLEVALLLKKLGILDLFKVKRLKRLFEWPITMLCCGRFTPSIGDSRSMFPEAVGWDPFIYRMLFRIYKEPRYAKAARDKPEPIAPKMSIREELLELFSPPVDEEINDAASRHPEPLGLESVHFPGYGLVILQTGKENRTALSLIYGMLHGHSHYDRLHIDLFSHGVALIPDFGYPETAVSTDPRRFGFLNNTVAHNTVVVNASKQRRARGVLHAYDVTPQVKVVEASAEDVYPNAVTLYRRTCILIDIDEDSAYLVDIFRVKGGWEHDWVIHGTDAELATEGVEITEIQERGTLAGAEVPYGLLYDDEELLNAPAGTSLVNYHGSGFSFLFDVKRGQPEELYRVKWSCRLKGAEDVNLRLHVPRCVGEEVIICKGQPPQKSARIPETVDFLVRRRKGENLESTFVAVMEPYKGKPRIRSVNKVDLKTGRGDTVNVYAIKVDFGEWTDYVFSSLDPEATWEFDGGLSLSGRVGFLRVDNEGRVVSAYLLDGRELAYGDFKLESIGPLEAVIEAVDYKGGTITLDRPIKASEETILGKTITIFNGSHATSYTVEDMIDERTISISDQDPVVGKGVVEVIDEEENSLSVTPKALPLVEPDMHLRDELGEAKFTIKRVEDGLIEVSGGRLTERSFPDVDGDGLRSFEVVDFGVGDRVIVHTSIYYPYSSKRRNPNS